MTIHLSSEREELVRALLEAGKFASADEVIDEALRLVGERYHESAPTEQTARPRDSVPIERASERLESIRALSRKFESMPTAAVTDGLTNRDHDRILYGQ
jgi:Arc/MetJ-type ribon-helix-helix transcriptional regulator